MQYLNDIHYCWNIIEHRVIRYWNIKHWVVGSTTTYLLDPYRYSLRIIHLMTSQLGVTKALPLFITHY